MYLEKLEIQGFKSFANKNSLIFPGLQAGNKRGITAIVGPNGSGKSNIADAVRWVLGEQSMKTLRGKKTEDVIFSGSDKKGKLGMAEVSLYLNNEQPGRAAGRDRRPAQPDGKEPGLIDYSQIILTRRIFRDGESEYLINNSRARLTDFQILLAQAKFGQKTYSVIGQGVVEGFLNTSLAERKEFFDEATGVKQFQIKRDEALNKLRLSYDNLHQAELLLQEIEPRLKSLTRQVNKLKQREQLEAELQQLQLDYYSQLWQEINQNFNRYNKEFLTLEQTKFNRENKLNSCNRQLNQLENQGQETQQLNHWQEQLNNIQKQKDLLTRQLARLEAKQEIKLEARGQFDLSWLITKKGEIKKEISGIQDEIVLLEKNIEHEKDKSQLLTEEKKSLAEKIDNLNERLADGGADYSGADLNQIKQYLESSLNQLKRAETIDDLPAVKKIISQTSRELNKILELSLKLKGRQQLEILQRQLTKLTLDKEEILTRINENNLRITARTERVKLIVERKNKLKSELTEIEQKLKQHGSGQSAASSERESQQLKNQLETTEQKINQAKEKINDFSLEQEAGRTRLFGLQKNTQELQQEINQLNNQLSELKINSTRYETRLEDLEIEIRNNLGSLKQVRQHQAGQTIDQAASREKISQLKRQLDLIGGLDPEIEKEYSEIKQRYDFLSGQATDLTQAIAGLEKIIKQLDLTIKDRFDREFKVIAQKFDQYFKIIFNGGNGRIIKVMEDDQPEETTAAGQDETAAENSPAPKKTSRQPEDKLKKIKFLQKHNATGLAGIEIQATPPGKKIKSVAMLSGGERALTAIALICAIISANPSPFVILDEVDAALDEANSERFAKIINDLSHKTQFIVITHNRASMRRANILYGVTMGNDSVSKLLSVKLEEAKMTG